MRAPYEMVDDISGLRRCKFQVGQQDNLSQFQAEHHLGT